MEPIFRIPNDWWMEPAVPGLTEQADWSHGYLGLSEVQAEAAGEGVLSIVLDTGIDREHPEFAGQLVEVRDFTRSLSGSDDVAGHGTHVAGTIGAKGYNEIGGRGIAFKGNLAIGKVLGDSGAGKASWILEGIRWARQVSKGWKHAVLNMSFGAGTLTEEIHAAILEFLADGVRLAVAAAGNDGARGTVGYPAAFDEVVSVGACDQLGNLTRFTSLNGRVDIVAPGAGIVAPVPRRLGMYASMDGTSMGAPCISGVSSCIFSADQLDGDQDVLTYEQMRTLMLKSAQSMTDGSGLKLINPRAFKDLVDNGQPPSPPAGTTPEKVAAFLGMEIYRPARAGDTFGIAFQGAQTMRAGEETLALLTCLQSFPVESEAGK